MNQTGVEQKYRRDLSSRSVDVRKVWDRAVDAWTNDDLTELDAIRDDIIQDLGSDYDGYNYVSSIGWAA